MQDEDSLTTTSNLVGRHFLQKHPLTVAAVGAWIIMIAVIVVLVSLNPDHRTVIQSYYFAAQNWWSAQPVYNMDGTNFLYLPPSILIYSPFWLLGKPLGHVMWIAGSAGVLTFAIWRLVSIVAAPQHRFRIFALVLLFAIPGSTGAIRNGQATILVLALMILAATYLVSERWWKAAICMTLAVGLKPICLPFLLMVGVLYWPAGWRTALLIPVMLVLTLLHFDPGYVGGEYRNFLENLQISFALAGRWSDINALFLSLGLDLIEPLKLSMRVIMAVVTLAAAFLATKKLDRVTTPIVILTLAVCYIMLFNPRTESNTYVMLAVMVSFFAVLLSYIEVKPVYAIVLVAMSVALGVNGLGRAATDFTEGWFKPLVCIGFLIVIAIWLRSGRSLAMAEKRL